jgi:hypothetical protein
VVVSEQEGTIVSNQSNDYLHEMFKAKSHTATDDYENDIKVAVTRAQNKRRWWLSEPRALWLGPSTSRWTGTC